MFLVKDDVSRYYDVYFIRNKSELFKYFKQYHAGNRCLVLLLP